MINKLKNFLLKVQEEFRGVSKGAIATVMLLETVVCLILIGVAFIASINVVATNCLADNAIEINRSMEREIYNLKLDRDTYKALYENAEQKISELNKVDNP